MKIYVLMQGKEYAVIERNCVEYLGTTWEDGVRAYLRRKDAVVAAKKYNRRVVTFETKMQGGDARKASSWGRIAEKKPLPKCPNCGGRKTAAAKLCGNCFVELGGAKAYKNGLSPLEVSK